MTEPDNGPDTDATILDQLVNEYLDCAEGVEKYQARKDELAAILAVKLGPGGRHEIVPGVGVTVARPARRFDPKLAQQVLTSDQLAMISEFTPSATLAAERLPGALVDLCKVSSGRPTVRRL